MKFYFDQHDGTTTELTYEELREHMSAYQIDEARNTKIERPDMELTYGTVGGRIRFECGESRKYVITYGGKADDGSDAENCVTFTTYTKEQRKFATPGNIDTYAKAHAALNGMSDVWVKTVGIYGALC